MISPCSECDKTFVFTTAIYFNYNPEKADCLNGGEHQWKQTNVHPRQYTKWFCMDCDAEKLLSETEMAALLMEKK